jgi:hypothetical protein
MPPAAGMQYYTTQDNRYELFHIIEIPIRAANDTFCRCNHVISLLIAAEAAELAITGSRNGDQ